MSEENIKRQSREIANAIIERHSPFGWAGEKLDGDPFHLRLYHPDLQREFLFRCVPSVTKADQTLVAQDKRPEYCVKLIVFRPDPGSKRLCSVRIE